MPPEDDSPYPRHPPGQSTPSALWWIALAVVLAGAAAAYYFLSAKPPATPSLPPGRTDATPAKPPAAAEPAIRYPLDAAQPDKPAIPLPALEQSDATLWEALAELLGRKPLGELLKPEQIVRNIVATVDNLPREAAPQRVMPILPTPGAFAVQGKGDAAVIARANAARYSTRLRLLQAIDSRRLVDYYLHFYPLLQKAYEELGFPGRYFNDRLIEAIDDLLAAPDLMAPPKLARPKVLYQYADPALEARSAGQKIMLRMGVGNAGLAKAKLREIRREILNRSRRQQ